MTLNDVCELIIDTEHKTAPTQESGYPSIRTPNIGKGRFLLDGVNRVSEETYRNWTKRAIPQADDLILAREAPVGNVAIIASGETFCLGQRTVLIRPDRNKVLPSFLCYYLLSDKIRNSMLSKSGGATVAHLNMKDIRALELGELPDYPNQQKIASILSAYDDLIENNTKRIKLLEEAAQNIYKDWFVNFRFPGYENVKFEKGLPEGWESDIIDNIASISGGGTPSTKEHAYWDGGDILWFSPTDLSKNKSLVLLDSEKKITIEGLKNSSAKLLPPRTILMSSRATIGLFGLISKQCSTNQGFINIIANEKAMQFFLLFNLKNRKQEILNKASGTTFKEISKKTFKEFELIVPDNRTLKKFDAIIEDVVNSIENLEQQNQQLKEARDILFPRLMNQTIEV